LSYAPAISCMKLNIHPGFGKSKLKPEKSTKKLCSVRKLATGRELGRIPKTEHKNGGERVRLPRFAKFRSKNRKFVVSTSDDVHNGTFLSAFSLMKRGKNGPFPIPYGEKMGKKWGSFFELYISHQTAS